jgi:hypothetical protein
MSLPFNKDLRGIKIYLRPNATDFRKGIATTVSLILGRMQIPMDEKSLFVFCSTSRKQIRIVYKENASIWMCTKLFRIRHNFACTKPLRGGFCLLAF